MIKYLTKCIFISSTHAIFDCSIRYGNAEVAECNVVINSELKGDYDLLMDNNYGTEVRNILPEIQKRCIKRAAMFFNKD